MKREDIEKMLHFMAGGVETAEEIKFIDKHLEGFNTFLLDMTTHRLVQAGIELEEAESMLHGLVKVSRMLGASQFNEFVQFHQIVDNI
jgi:hypothetical protein